MARLGHDVLGADTDAGRIPMLVAGHPPLIEPGLVLQPQPEIRLRDECAVGWR